MDADKNSIEVGPIGRSPVVPFCDEPQDQAVTDAGGDDRGTGGKRYAGAGIDPGGERTTIEERSSDFAEGNAGGGDFGVMHKKEFLFSGTCGVKFRCGA